MRYVDDEGNVMGCGCDEDLILDLPPNSSIEAAGKVMGYYEPEPFCFIDDNHSGLAQDPRRREAETRVERFKRGGCL